MSSLPLLSLLFFFNDTATTEIYTLSLHDALPISRFLAAEVVAGEAEDVEVPAAHVLLQLLEPFVLRREAARSEEHTSELQSHVNLVCRLLLEKKKKK